VPIFNEAAGLSRTENANRLADDLESLRTGRLSEHAFRAKWQVATVPELVSVIGPNLEHYLANRLWPSIE
jgi:hypothetical protein